MKNWRSAKTGRAIVAVLLTAALVASCGGPGEEAMDHSAHEGMPGMGSNQATATLEDDTSLNALLRSPNAFVVADLGTVTLQQREMPLEFHATGTITYDPRNVRKVSARTSGWVEKLYVNYQFQPVKKGEPIMELYSRELVTEQENYLLLAGQEPGDPRLLLAAKKRLSLLGLTDAQIATLGTTGKVSRTITYYSPYTGHLHEPDGASAAEPGAMAMRSNDAGEPDLREGGYVEKGATLFSIYGTDPVLALLNILPADGQDRIEVGQPVTVRVEDDAERPFTGRVDLVEPVYREGASIVAVRTYLPNPGDALRIGARVSAVISAGSHAVMAVPSTAVLGTGLRQFVFVRETGGFRARQITTGLRAEGWIEVQGGIAPDEAIADNAQLLLDSESFLNVPQP